MTKLNPALTRVLQFLSRHPQVRQCLAAPPDKTIVYSGPIHGQGEVLAAWKALAQAKTTDPKRFDYVTLEERLRQFHITDFGASLFDQALRVASSLNLLGRKNEALVLWRALSGIHVQGAKGRVRALVMPGPGISRSVFNLPEVNVLLRPDVLRQIEIDPNLLRDFRVQVRAVGGNVGFRPIVAILARCR